MNISLSIFTLLLEINQLRLLVVGFRPNCFQLVTNALQHYQIYYLCAENTDNATVSGSQMTVLCFLCD